MSKYPPDPQEVVALTALVDQFIHERLQAKLDKLKPDELEKRQDLLLAHQRAVWLADAAKRVSQIQLATHTVKPVHPDARASSIYLSQAELDEPTLFGTHTLQGQQADDVVGNAAALDVFKFLKLSHAGQSVLQRCLQDDPALQTALNPDPSIAQAWVQAFAGVAQAPATHYAHSLLKQVYEPVELQEAYHLLVPLFPTALAHEVHGRLQVDRFSDAAKDARKARREGLAHPQGYRDYPNLAVRNFGGSKPQNISQLNSERGGVNTLLASVPPIWSMSKLSPPLRHESVFDERAAFGGKRSNKMLRTAFGKFLKQHEHENNRHLLDEAKAFVDELIANLLEWSAQIQALPPGWSVNPQCHLHPSEKRWLDPMGQAQKQEQDQREKAKAQLVPTSSMEPDGWEEDEIALDEGDENTPSTASDVARHFARWLIKGLAEQKVHVSDEAGAVWKKQLWKELADAQSLQD